MARYTEQDREEAATLYIVQELPFEEIVQVLAKRDPKRWGTLCKKSLLHWAGDPDTNGDTWFTRRAKQIASLHKRNDLKVGRHQAKWVEKLTKLLDSYLEQLSELEFGEKDKSGATHATLAILRELRALTGIGVQPARSGMVVNIDQSDRRQVLVYLDVIVDSFCGHPIVGPVASQHKAEILDTIKGRILALERGDELAPALGEPECAAVEAG